MNRIETKTFASNAAGRKVFDFVPPNYIETPTGFRVDFNREPAVDYSVNQTGIMVDLLCATHEKRHGFFYYMLSSFYAQTYRNKRLIIADSSPSPRRVDFPGAFYFHLPGFTLGQQRNFLMNISSSPLFAWFDDDEGRDPTWLSRLVYSWDRFADIVTPKRSVIVDLIGERETVYQVPTASSQSAIFGQRCKGHHFDPSHRYEEIAWLQKITGVLKLQRVDCSLVYQLVHGENYGMTTDRHFKGDE